MHDLNVMLFECIQHSCPGALWHLPLTPGLCIVYHQSMHGPSCGRLSSSHPRRLAAIATADKTNFEISEVDHPLYHLQHFPCTENGNLPIY